MYESLRGVTTDWSPDKVPDVLKEQAAQTRQLIQLEQETRSLFLSPEDPIEVLGLSKSVTRRLKRSRIYTVGQLTEITEDELGQLDFGAEGLEEVEEKLAERYLTLRL